MDTLDWKDFLTDFNKLLLKSKMLKRHLKLTPELYPPEILKAGWLGYPGATEEKIAKAEARLNIKLPPSYREFLKVSNGWRCVNWFIPQLWSTEQLEWFAVRRAAMLGLGGVDDCEVPDEEYLLDSPLYHPSSIRWSYLLTNLEISDMEIAGSAILMLNPEVSYGEGEWEAWYFAHWIPGAERYFSFKELMKRLYNDLRYE